jgi:endonuclease III
MPKPRPRLAIILDRIEEAYGPVRSGEPRDAYELILYRNSGYPQSDANCASGFKALKTDIGLEPSTILASKVARLRKALRAGGIVPEVRAERVREIARRVRDEFGGDLGKVLALPPAEARKVLASFPTVAEAGADKILLFTRTSPVAALPSNSVHVPVRLGYGTVAKSWSKSYRTAQAAVAAELPERYDDRIRAHLLIKSLGHEVCKLARPLCEQCPVAALCPSYGKFTPGPRR